MLRMASDMFVRPFNLINVTKEPTSEPTPPFRSHKIMCPPAIAVATIKQLYSKGSNCGKGPVIAGFPYVFLWIYKVQKC